jgi:sarcosine oxidase subunit delta
MLLIPCPYCGPRAESEFHWGGESHLSRPGPYEAVSDAEWGQYLYYRENPKGLGRERWRHTFGCRQWFNLVRDTASHRILGSYRMGDVPPAEFGARDDAGRAP